MELESKITPAVYPLSSVNNNKRIVRILVSYDPFVIMIISHKKNEDRTLRNLNFIIS
jgi:hypothetical protein